MLSEGQVVLDRYVIDRLIGAGGMGLIYRARDQEKSTWAAIKILKPHPDLTDRDILRFQREARMLTQLKHPHVLSVWDVGEIPEVGPFLTMELLEGRDLRQEIRVRGKFPMDEAAGYILQACEAVGAVHAAGIIHRDIKPQNLFVTGLDGARNVKLLDFGISKISESNEATLTATQGMLGTPQYMSPEQIFSARDVDGRTDIWSLGVILYFLVTGQLPFSGPTSGAIISQIPNVVPVSPKILRPELPEAFSAIIEKCLSKEPANRYHTARELREALEPFGPPEGVLLGPAIDVPSTVPPVKLEARQLWAAARLGMTQGRTTSPTGTAPHDLLLPIEFIKGVTLTGGPAAPSEPTSVGKRRGKQARRASFAWGVGAALLGAGMTWLIAGQLTGPKPEKPLGTAPISSAPAAAPIAPAPAGPTSLPPSTKLDATPPPVPSQEPAPSQGPKKRSPAKVPSSAPAEKAPEAKEPANQAPLFL